MSIKYLFFITFIFFTSRFLLTYFLQNLSQKIELKHRINPTQIHPMQTKRESMWPIGLLMDALFFIFLALPLLQTLGPAPFFISLGVMVLGHMFVVEPIYYLFHRLLHTSWIYRNHHIYHHKSVVTEPTTSMSFTNLERFSYTVLFTIPIFIAYVLGVFNEYAFLTFFLLFDTINAIGHLNIPLETERYKNSKLLKWLIYSPEFHEKHHSQFTTNYARCIPIYH